MLKPKRGTRATNENQLDEFPCVKGFFQMKESGSFGAQILDSVTGSIFEFNTTCVEGDTPSVNLSIRGGADLISGTGIENPSNRDFLLISCGQAVTGASGTGALSAYMTGGSKKFRVQPYYGLMGTGTHPADRIAPPTNQAMQLPLVAGTDYIQAFGKQGNTILHVGDNGDVNTQDVQNLLIDSGDESWNTKMLALHSKINAEDTTRINTLQSFGHAGIGKILTKDTGEVWVNYTYPPPHASQYTGSSSPDEWEIPSQFPVGQTDEAQLYYGVMLCVFENGLPDDYAEAIAWMKRKWTKGRMDVWPGWRD